MNYQLIGNGELSSQIGIILPTYREEENISKLIEAIENLKIDASILVIDDSSPDGTAKIVKEKQSKYSNIRLMIRPKKSGLGTAITDGFRFFLSLKQMPKYVMTMDADYSHNPKDIPRLLSTMYENDCAIVIGSRYVKGGKIEGWNLYRKILSKGAIILARVFTNVKDPMSGFFMFKKELIINKIINPKGFKILLEFLIKLDSKKFKKTWALRQIAA